ncbi:unnamed protein product [Durusdinium trenchii]|uniref:Uncharacterized protein n=1 Tax=Durusdinium trenchii TaxID=1381693 RepID=A0ABP0RLZ8_9DINO
MGRGVENWFCGGALIWLVLLCVEGGASDDLVVRQSHGKGAKRPKGALAVSRDIERRVVEAGGNTEGVMVVSLSWASADDLDLHVVLPGGEEISYKRKKAAGGELDVDMCVQGRHSGKCAERPVENVVFDYEPPAGRYKIFVQNFNYHLNTLPENMQVARMQEGIKTSKEERELRLSQNRPVLFDLLVKVHGVKKLFEGLCTPTGKTLASSDVRVIEFDYDPQEESFTTDFEASPSPECTQYTEKLKLAAPEKRRSLPGRDAKVTSVEQKNRDRGGKGAGKTDGKGRDAKRSAALQAVRSAPESLSSKPVWSLGLEDTEQPVNVLLCGCKCVFKKETAWFHQHAFHCRIPYTSVYHALPTVQLF